MSKIAESSAAPSRSEPVGAKASGVGASVKSDVGAIKNGVGAMAPDARVAPLLLPSPSALYRFANVGAVFEIHDADKAKISAIFTDAGGKTFEVPVTFPGGNWLLVSVGDISNMEKPGFAKIDNPYTE
jgi:hypothetical protein